MKVLLVIGFWVWGALAVPEPATRADLREVAVIGSPGDGRGQLMEPSGVAVDAFGHIVVSDAVLHRIQRFDAAGRWLGESGSLGSDPNQMRRPGSVAPLGASAIAVLDRENRRVVSYDLQGYRQGTVLSLADEALERRLGRVDPTALATDRGGALYIVDAARDQILAFDFSGRLERVVGSYGSKPGQFRGLEGLATGPHGQLVTAERLNARVQRLDSSGRPLMAWPLAIEKRRGALAVAVDDSGRVAVAEEASGRMWIYGAAGELLASTDGLARPRALAFAPDGTLLVAEAGAGRVRRWAVPALRPPRGGDEAVEGGP